MTIHQKIPVIDVIQNEKPDHTIPGSQSGQNAYYSIVYLNPQADPNNLITGIDFQLRYHEQPEII